MRYDDDDDDDDYSTPLPLRCKPPDWASFLAPHNRADPEAYVSHLYDLFAGDFVFVALYISSDPGYYQPLPN